jgi:AcrR family transcriptional regulator
MTHAGISNDTPTKRRRDPKATHDRLVRAALELFTTQGYHASTTPQIARRAGVAEGTIYRHFSSKEQLLNEIYRAAVQHFTQFVTGSPGAIACRERLSTIAEAWTMVAARDPGLVKLVFVTPPSGLLDSRSHSSYRTLRTELEKVLAAGKAGGEIRPGPVELWSDVWLQLVRLALQRVAAADWTADHPSTGHVVNSAWSAISAPAPRR